MLQVTLKITKHLLAGQPCLQKIVITALVTHIFTLCQSIIPLNKFSKCHFLLQNAQQA